jgi:hypothetical protein
MAQKPTPRAEVYARAVRASQNVKRAEVWVGARCAYLGIALLVTLDCDSENCDFTGMQFCGVLLGYLLLVAVSFSDLFALRSDWLLLVILVYDSEYE